LEIPRKSKRKKVFCPDGKRKEQWSSFWTSRVRRRNESQQTNLYESNSSSMKGLERGRNQGNRLTMRTPEALREGERGGGADPTPKKEKRGGTGGPVEGEPLIKGICSSDLLVEKGGLKKQALKIKEPIRRVRKRKEK